MFATYWAIQNQVLLSEPSEGGMECHQVSIRSSDLQGTFYASRMPIFAFKGSRIPVVVGMP
jgi:hypothetical protein